METVNDLIALARSERQQIEKALLGDANDTDYQKRIEAFNAGDLDIFPAGRTARLLGEFSPRTGVSAFDGACQQALGDAKWYGFSFFQPAIETLLAAHRNLLQEARGAYELGRQRLVGTTRPHDAAVDALLELTGEAEPETATSVDEGETTSPVAPSNQFVFAPDGDGYDIEGFGENGHFRAMNGFRYIHRLLQTPGEAVGILELLKADVDQLVYDRTSRQPAIDRDTIKLVNDHRDTAEKLTRRLEEAVNDLEKSRSENNPAGIFENEKEIEFVKGELAGIRLVDTDREINKATGKGGKPRDLNSRFDAKSKAILNSLRRAYKKLRDASPPMKEMADHLSGAIGSASGEFSYTDPGLSIDWVLEKDRKNPPVTQIVTE